MKIIAHRANLAGPNSCVENSFEAIERALSLGFGIETDLRRSKNGAFYISHDPATHTPENDFGQYAHLFRCFPENILAMNVKELGYEDALIRLYLDGALGSAAFYFDFELLEPDQPGTAQRRLCGLPHGSEVLLASRLSDRNEPLAQCLGIPAGIVWVDEFDSLWITDHEVAAIRHAGRKIFAISPELHGFDRQATFKRWADFQSWGIDGLCTDFALAARDFLT